MNFGVMHLEAVLINSNLQLEWICAQQSCAMDSVVVHLESMLIDSNLQLK